MKKDIKIFIKGSVQIFTITPSIFSLYRYVGKIFHVEKDFFLNELKVLKQSKKAYQITYKHLTK